MSNQKRPSSSSVLKKKIRAPSDKENVKQKSKSSGTSPPKIVISSARNPLSNLCENVLPSKICVSAPRSKSTSGLETNSAFNHDKFLKRGASLSRPIKRPQACNVINFNNSKESNRWLYPISTNINERCNYSLENEDEESYDASFATQKKRLGEHLRASSRKNDSKISKTLPVVRVSSGSNALNNSIKKPAQKQTLIKKLSHRCRRTRGEGLYSDCLYDTDYFPDNYEYMLNAEGNFVFRKSFLMQYVDYSCRVIVVNWLVYVQQVLDLAESTFFAAVRMFDYILIVSNVPNAKYSLVGIVCMWIASKMFDVQVIMAPKLFSLCNEKFSKQQLLSMEKEILSILKFKINFPEPTTFLYYYLKKLNLEDNRTIRFSAMFLLETFALLLEFSSTAPSLLAASALHLSLLKFEKNCDEFLDYIHSHLVNKDMFKRFSEQMLALATKVLEHKNISGEVIEKYSVMDRSNITKHFINTNTVS